MEQSSNLEVTLSELESLTTDPFIARIYDRARELEAMMNETGEISDEDRRALTEELDGLWPFMGADLKISGRLSFKKDDEDEIVSSYYEELDVQSNGFCFVDDHIMVDGEIVAKHYKVGLHLIKFEDEAHTTGTLGVGFLDDISVDYPASSMELIQNRLRYYHADIMEDLDIIVLNCEHEDPAVMALKDFTVTANPNKPEDVQKIMDMQNYLHSVLEFDYQLPYAITFHGKCFYAFGDTVAPAFTEEPIAGLATASRVQFMLVEDQEDGAEDLVYTPCVDVLMYGVDKNGTPSHMYIPVTSLEDFTSVRRQAYSDYQQQ